MPKSLPEIENQILDFWDKEAIFSKTVEARKDGDPYVFYDGPPFTTGSPHYGHIMQMANKDAVIRYRTMQGFNVPRTIGWDTHGLPVEYQLEKELGLKGGKRAIEDYGIEKFVEAARGIVLRAVDDWKGTMRRMGRWVDTSRPYKTMDNDYIESVWWAFKSLYDKGLVYKDFRVSPYCPRCGTVLSNFELNQGYKDNVADTSMYALLPVTTEGKFKDSLLVFWTTTPWSSTAVVAMSVNPEAEYVLIEHNRKRYVLAKARYRDVLAEGEVIETFKGEELIGIHYKPLYPNTPESNVHRVVAGDHVTTEDGTGIASIAPAYGEVDFQVGKQEGLPVIQTVQADGSLKVGYPGQEKFVKDAEKDILEDLRQRDRLLKQETIHHTYPFCWRCDTPLLYYPATSWYVKVVDIKENLVSENKKIAWQPEHLRDGRFGRWLEGARDWAISRERYWGAPLPVWECGKCQTVTVIGSRTELGVDGEFDLHRPYIDEKTITCECGEQMQRVPYVFDCWFESGSMPFAQHHYPFKNKDRFNPDKDNGYPAAFIAEALDQTRGWFYTLHVLGIALFGERAYNNVIVTGLIQASDGKKLSKSLRNYVDPNILFEQEGVDALRLFLFTAASLGEDYRFTDAAVADVKRRWITPLLNVAEYYKLCLADKDESVETKPEHAELDRWIKSRVAETRASVIYAMEGNDRYSPHDLVRACRNFGPLVEDLSTWYVRLSRGRKDASFSQTLKQALVEISMTFAPFIPFVTEHIYQEVTLQNDDSAKSVHMCLLKPLDDWQDEETLKGMEIVRGIVSVGRDLRAKSGIANRQPLIALEMAASRYIRDPHKLLIKQELNVENVVPVKKVNADFPQSEYDGIGVGLNTVITDELKQKGAANNLRRVIQDLRKQANLTPGDHATVFVSKINETIKELTQVQLPTTKIIEEESDSPLAEAEFEGNVIKLYK